jgi:hypothetical protein
MVVQGLHGFDGDRRDCWPHALCELHFCVLIRARCCSEDTGERSFSLRLAPQARAFRLGVADKLLQFTSRNYYQACCLLFTSRFCSRSPGRTLEGRAYNSYLVELCNRSIPTSIYVYSIVSTSLSNYTIPPLKAVTRLAKLGATAQENEHSNLTNTIELRTFS